MKRWVKFVYLIIACLAVSLVVSRITGVSAQGGNPSPYLLATLVNGVLTYAPASATLAPGGNPPEILCETINVSNQLAYCSFSGGSGTVTSIATTAPITGGTITTTGTIACPTCTVTIAHGSTALNTALVASGACETLVTATATGTVTTDVITVGFNGDPTSTTGYGKSATGAVLTIYPYPSADTVNLAVCNSTSGSITPSALTLNWRVER